MDKETDGPQAWILHWGIFKMNHITCEWYQDKSDHMRMIPCIAIFYRIAPWPPSTNVHPMWQWFKYNGWKQPCSIWSSNPAKLLGAVWRGHKKPNTYSQSLSRFSKWWEKIFRRSRTVVECFTFTLVGRPQSISRSQNTMASTLSVPTKAIHVSIPSFWMFHPSSFFGIHGASKVCRWWKAQRDMTCAEADFVSENHWEKLGFPWVNLKKHRDTLW